MMLLEVKNIFKSFEGPSGEKEMTVLEDISFRLDDGESIAVVGPSGSGKSTLLNIIGSLDRPSSGEVFFNGKNLASLKDDQLSSIRISSLQTQLFIIPWNKNPGKKSRANVKIKDLTPSLLDNTPYKSLELLVLPGIAHRLLKRRCEY